MVFVFLVGKQSKHIKVPQQPVKGIFLNDLKGKQSHIKAFIVTIEML